MLSYFSSLTEKMSTHFEASRAPGSDSTCRKEAAATVALAGQGAGDTRLVSKAPVGRYRSLHVVGSREDTTASDELKEALDGFVR